MMQYVSYRVPRVHVEVVDTQARDSCSITTSNDCVEFSLEKLHAKDDVLSVYVAAADFVYDALSDGTSNILFSGDENALLLAIASIVLNKNLHPKVACEDFHVKNATGLKLSSYCNDMIETLCIFLYGCTNIPSSAHHFRFAVGCKAEAVTCLQIYQHHVLTSYASFEVTPPTLSDFLSRICGTLLTHPWLVAIDVSSCDIIGYAYAAPHKTREAYQWSADVSVYICPDHCRRGIGSQLYDILLHSLHFMGVITLCAGIALPNEASVKLHESYGFRSVGIYKNVGYKFDEWRDVLWMQKNILEDIPKPPPPLLRFGSNRFSLMSALDP